jgi:hypothetical protein
VSSLLTLLVAENYEETRPRMQPFDILTLLIDRRPLHMLLLKLTLLVLLLVSSSCWTILFGQIGFLKTLVALAIIPQLLLN